MGPGASHLCQNLRPILWAAIFLIRKCQLWTVGIGKRMKMKEGSFYTSYLLLYGHLLLYRHEGFPGGASGKEPAYQCRRHKRPRFNPWVRKISWGRAWQPTPVLLPGGSHEQRSLVGIIPRVTQSHTRLKQLSMHTYGLEFEQTPGDSGGQRSLACYSPWGHKESDIP